MAAGGRAFAMEQAIRGGAGSNARGHVGMADPIPASDQEGENQRYEQ
jgi:hypothetical protein